MNGPLVSAVMANYNDVATIGEALDALLGQSYRNIEIIVVDDASTDDSLEVIDGIAKHDARVQVIRHTRNAGPIHAQMTGLKRAEGDFVFVPSANDRALPGFLEKQLECLERHVDAAVCFCDLVCLDDPDRNEFAGIAHAPVYLSAEAVVDLLSRRHAFMLGGISLVKRTALADAGWLIPELRWMADFFAFQTVVFRHGVAHVPEALYAVRKPIYSEVGPRSAAQQEAILCLVGLLGSPEYADVLPAFRRSGILAAVPGLLRLALRRAEHWRVLSPVQVRRALWNEIKDGLRPLTPPSLRQAYRRERDRWLARISDLP